MQILQQTYIEFLNTINTGHPYATTMIQNTSQNRRFFSVKVGSEWYHGLRSKKEAEKVYNQLKTYESQTTIKQYIN